MNRTIRITVLVENTAQGAGILAEHGLAYWIEWDGQKVLFDTGQGNVLASNAYRLGIPLHEADAVMLSHGHYDYQHAPLHPQVDRRASHTGRDRRDAPCCGLPRADRADDRRTPAVRRPAARAGTLYGDARHRCTVDRLSDRLCRLSCRQDISVRDRVSGDDALDGLSDDFATLLPADRKLVADRNRDMLRGIPE